MTDLVDPSPQPELQGTDLGTERPSTPEARATRRAERARRERRARQTRQPPPVEPLVPPQLQPAVRKYRSFAFVALGLIAVLHAVAAVVILVLVFRDQDDTADPSPDKSGEDSTSWMEGLRIAVVVMFKFALLGVGGERLFRKGVLSLLGLLGWTFADEWSFGLAYAILPFAITMIEAGLMKPICKPDHDINKYIPVRTRGDIKGILDAWYNSTYLLFQTGLTIPKLRDWPFTFGYIGVFVLSAAVTSAVRLKIGLCRYNTATWSIWFSLFGAFASVWFISNADGLLKARQMKDLGHLHAELLLFVLVLYTLRWAPVQAFCEVPECG